MKVITPNGVFDTKDDLVTLVFENDEEFSSFASKIVTFPVKTGGTRVIPIIDSNKKLSEKQIKILSILEELDGIGGKEHDSICDNAIESLENLIKKE